MSGKRNILLCVLLPVLLSAIPAGAASAQEKGLLFKSYDVTPSQRTSLNIPSGEDRFVNFSDSLKICFRLNLNLEKGNFGYICRVMLDRRESVDLLLFTPEDGKTYLGSTADHERIVKFEANSGEWQDMSLLIQHKDEEMVASLNGRIVAAIPTDRKKHEVKVCFGLNRDEGFATSDVAPMAIHDLKISADRRKADCWQLDSPEDFAFGHRYSCKVENAIWLGEFNRHWHRQWSISLPSVSHLAFDQASGTVWIVSEGQVLAYDPVKKTADLHRVSRDIKCKLVTDDFLVISGDVGLNYVDVDVPEMIRFDVAKGDWEKDNQRVRCSVYLHNNMAFCPGDSLILHLFGYGQHRYSNDICVWSLGDGKVRRSALQGIDPRYLSALGLYEGKAYIFGGKGNTRGVQELGTQIYGDFHCLDLTTMETTKLWEIETSETPASDLLFLPEGDCFLALCFNSNVYDSSLQLRRFSTKDGSSQAISEPIPYNFLDTQSEARLAYCRQTQEYNAIITCQNNDGQYEAAVYSIRYPLTASESGVQRRRPSILWFQLSILILLVLSAALAIRYVGHGKKTEKSDAAVVPVAPKGPCSYGIHLLGGFKVVTRDGFDISSEFSPLMRQMLCMLILNTCRKGGISNADLKNSLWFDKSDESYNNNRGVTLKKIRTCLERVDDGFSILNQNGFWSVNDANGICDCLNVNALLSSPGHSLEELLSFASCGSILPDQNFDWLDPFKASYEDRILSALSAFRRHIDKDESAEEAIRISDAMLSFDSLDEDSVRIKCQALIFLKKVGIAKKTFDSFTEEYQRVLCEEFAVPFADFIK